MTKENKINTNANGFNTVKEFRYNFGGRMIRLFLSIAISGEIARERELAVGETEEERIDRLPGFRARLIANVLDREPELIESIRQEPKTEGGDVTFTARYSPLPDFPKGEPNVNDLEERALKYFSQTDERGRPIFRLFLEQVVADYWTWANPRPIFSVSEYTPTN